MKTHFKKIASWLFAAFLMVFAVPMFTMNVSATNGGAATIGSTEYETLAEAIKSVAKDTTATPTTIKIEQDLTISDNLMIGHQYTQNIIIDLNGHTLSANSIVLTSYRSGSTLTVQNGTVSGNATTGTLRATYGGKIVLGDDLTIKGAGGSATLVYVNNGSVEIVAKNGVTFAGGKVDFRKNESINADLNKINVGASIERRYFGTLTDAVAAANDGDVVTMLNDVELKDTLVIDKAITLDGDGKALTSTAGRAINVNTNGEATIKNLTVNCTGERAINVIQKSASLTIENVTATAKNYTVNVASSAGAAKLTITGSTLNGLNAVNVAGAGAEVTVTNSTIHCNDENTTTGEIYAAICLNKDAINGKITVTNCEINVTGDSEVARNSAVGGTVTINGSTDQVSTTVAIITNGSNYYYGFYTLADAIGYAEDGNTITLIRDINLTAEDFGEKVDGYNTFFNISGKTLTIDLNGNTIIADVSATDLDAFILGVFATTNNGHLTLTDSKGNGGVKGVSGATQEQAYLDKSKGNKDYNYKFYCLMVAYDNDCSITVEGGNYDLDYAGDSIAYSSGNEGVVVNGGTFKLGNLGGIRNGMPWVFNAKGQNIRHVVVNGGSFCADIQHQYYPFEVQVPKEVALQYDGEMYTAVPAVAYVTEREWSSAWYTNEIGYATLEEAISACEGPKTKSKKTSEQEVVVLLKDVTLAENTTLVIDKPVAIDLNGKTIYGENSRTATHNFLIDVKGGTLTASNGTIAMKHTGTDMDWNGATTVIDVTAGGVLNLNGVTVQNQGGTDMNFAVHMNNWGEVTLNADNCVFDATYCGVRVFNSGFDMNNVTITNSKLTGATRAFWVHNYLGDLDSNKHSDEAIKARLNLDIYGNNNTFEITGTAKSPIRYGFNNTVYFNAEGSQVVDTAEDLQDAINNGSGDITLGGDIDLNDLINNLIP